MTLPFRARTVNVAAAMRTFTHALLVVTFLSVLATPTRSGAATTGDQSQGGRLFQQRCATCHDAPVGRIPSRDQLRQRSPDEVLQALRVGIMREQAKSLSVYQMQLIAGFLTGTEPGEHRAAGPENNPCSAAPPALVVGADDWNGWGRDDSNARFQPHPGFSAAELPRLKLKWAYGYRGSYAYGQPTVVAGRIFAPSSTGRIYSLDARTGCTYFTFDADTSTRTAIVLTNLPAKSAHRHALIFGDDAATLYSVDADDGRLIWKIKADPHPAARITGAPKIIGTRIYVPIASLEEVSAADPSYACCTFVGKVIAVDLETGQPIWTARMAGEPQPLPAGGTSRFGPAGVSIWNSPTVDVKRGVLYVGTGNSYTSVDSQNSDSVIALKLSDGSFAWSHQLLPGDNYTVGCPAVNCPPNSGPDFDFGASVILQRLASGKSMLFASQKSGAVYALDDRGHLLWQARVGKGSPIGGVEWGSAADGTAIYVPISDALLPRAQAEPGLTAFALDSGKKLWQVKAPTPECAWGAQDNCLHAFQQAVTVIPGAVFSGSLDGHLRAYATRDGSLLWDYDTAHSYQAVNQLPTEGGSLDLGGAVIVGGTLYVNSGYGRLVGRPGNALLAFSIDGL